MNVLSLKGLRSVCNLITFCDQLFRRKGQKFPTINGDCIVQYCDQRTKLFCLTLSGFEPDSPRLSGKQSTTVLPRCYFTSKQEGK